MTPQEQIEALEAQIETQAYNFERKCIECGYLRDDRDRLQRMYDDSQDYITKLKAQREELRAQLTPEAKAEWIFEHGYNLSKA